MGNIFKISEDVYQSTLAYNSKQKEQQEEKGPLRE
jgi:hypothetical protein